jgi:hypothetical protein
VTEGKSIVPAGRIENRILLIRDEKVIKASVYQVEDGRHCQLR